eukprot:Pgem_evm1s17014
MSVGFSVGDRVEVVGNDLEGSRGIISSIIEGEETKYVINMDGNMNETLTFRARNIKALSERQLRQQQALLNQPQQREQKKQQRQQKVQPNQNELCKGSRINANGLKGTVVKVNDENVKVVLEYGNFLELTKEEIELIPSKVLFDDEIAAATALSEQTLNEALSGNIYVMCALCMRKRIMVINTSRKDLNGMFGCVLKPITEKGRYEIVLDDGRNVSLKPINIRRMSYGNLSLQLQDNEFEKYVSGFTERKSHEEIEKIKADYRINKRAEIEAVHPPVFPFFVGRRFKYQQLWNDAFYESDRYYSGLYGTITGLEVKSHVYNVTFDNGMQSVIFPSNLGPLMYEPGNMKEQKIIDDFELKLKKIVPHLKIDKDIDQKMVEKRVVVIDTSREDLNGSFGTVIDVDAEKGRYTTALDNGNIVGFRPTNLRFLRWDRETDREKISLIDISRE